MARKFENQSAGDTNNTIPLYVTQVGVSFVRNQSWVRSDSVKIFSEVLIFQFLCQFIIFALESFTTLLQIELINWSYSLKFLSTRIILEIFKNY